jgi:glycosyltransferase involved in cell wall biosynthesis
MGEPLVSVITPFYNTAPYLAGCIESVLAQTYRNFEYLLVNNKSTDGSRDIAARYIGKDSRIRLLDNEEFVGQVENYNGAVARIDAASKYLKIVQADDAIYPDCIARMVELAESNPSVGLVSAFWMNGDVPMGTGVPREQSVVLGKEACRQILLGNSSPLGSPTSVMYRADVVRARKPFYAVGRYHEDTEAAFEILLDHDFGFVHQILSFVRTDNISITTSRADLNAVDLDHLITLERFGPSVLSAAELSKCRRNSHRGYYRFLGRALLRMRDRRFWEYHHEGLQTIGWKLSWPRVAAEAAMEAVRLAVNPGLTIERAVKDVRQRKSR